MSNTYQNWENTIDLTTDQTCAENKINFTADQTMIGLDQTCEAAPPATQENQRWSLASEDDWKHHAPRVFTLFSRPLEYFQENYLEKRAPPNSNERNALSQYIDNGDSLWINNYLRGMHMQELKDDDIKKLSDMSSVLNRLVYDAPTSPHTTFLFRGIAQNAPRQTFYTKMAEAEFLTRGILSTSISYKSALKFVEYDETCCLLVLLVPKGTHMLQILDKASIWPAEREVLLPHRSVFKIFKTATINGIKTYYCYLHMQQIDK